MVVKVYRNMYMFSEMIFLFIQRKTLLLTSILEKECVNLFYKIIFRRLGVVHHKYAYVFFIDLYFNNQL